MRFGYQLIDNGLGANYSKIFELKMDETSCPVCWEEFSDLIGKTYILEYLPCHHHICQACYNSMHTSHICPLCRGTMISLVSNNHFDLPIKSFVSPCNSFVL